MKAVNTESIRRLLQSKYETVDYQANMVATFAQGNVGKAIALTTDSRFIEIRDKVVALCKRAGRMDEAQIADEVKEIKKENDDDKDVPEDEKYQGFMEQMLELITLWFKDVLLYKATLNDNLLLFKEDSFEIHEQASRCSYSGLNEIFDTISQTRARLNANVNFELTIMLLIKAIKENTR
jgi:DNA polymerase-3 subunit delta'